MKERLFQYWRGPGSNPKKEKKIPAVGVDGGKSTTRENVKPFTNLELKEGIKKESEYSSLHL